MKVQSWCGVGPPCDWGDDEACDVCVLAARVGELEKEKLKTAMDWLSSEGQWVEQAAKSQTHIKELEGLLTDKALRIGNTQTAKDGKRIFRLETALRNVFLVHHGGLTVDGHFQYDEDEDECIEIADELGFTKDTS